MVERLDYFTTSPKAMEILLSQESYLGQKFSDNKALLELVKLRVSQVNQCAYCLDMHTKDVLKLGESAERVYGLMAWQDSPFYSKLERIALKWAELITSGKQVTNEEYQCVLDAFGENSLVDLTIAINAINSWNRIAKAFKPEVGSYQPS